jgi:hypothetical protein
LTVGLLRSVSRTGSNNFAGMVDASHCSMGEDLSMGEMVKKTEAGRGRRWVIVVLAAIVVVVLLGIVVSAFRGKNIARNSDAITAPASNSPAKTAWRPWWVH